jgi:phosphoglycolate phosphatase-like HAD superfamily hydrolase
MDSMRQNDTSAAGKPGLPVPEHTDTAALAFDFDGTLINSGLDKGVHILCAVWAAFFENGLSEYLHPTALEIDVERMEAAYLQYPGAPRFQQLSALANSLINDDTRSLNESELATLPPHVYRGYPGLKESYNSIYSGLNNSAAAAYWRPFEAAEAVLRRLSRRHDLYIASGVTADLLLEDIERYSLDSTLFKGIYGGNSGGGADKGELLLAIQGLHYPALLFVGDSNRDLAYAREAGAAFFRIRENDDFFRLEKALETHTPNQPEFWEFSDEEKLFLFEKSLAVIRSFLVRGKTRACEQMIKLIHEG